MRSGRLFTGIIVSLVIWLCIFPAAAAYSAPLTVDSPDPLNNQADILAFTLPTVPGAGTAIISSTAAATGTIGISVPYGTAVNALAPSFTLSDGAYANVSGVTQVSGGTVNDFTNPVVYQVIAADGVTIKFWSVTVTFAPETAAEITSFNLPGQVGSAMINSDTGTIQVIVPYGSDVANRESVFTLSQGASATVSGVTQVSGVTYNDFSVPVAYQVTAADGVTSKTWIVTVLSSANTAAEITAFQTVCQEGPAVINSETGTIDISIRYNTFVTLYPSTFTLSDGATARVGSINQISGSTRNDFSSPVVYVVTAADGTTTKTWTVNPTVLPSKITDPLTYTLPGQVGSTIIYPKIGSIKVRMPYGTDVSSLVGTFTLAPGAIARIGSVTQVSGVTANDFTSELLFNVTAADGVTKRMWFLTVAFTPNTAAEITSFSMPGQTGSAVINGNDGTILVTVPYGTDRSALVPSFTLSSGAVATIDSVDQESGITSNNFNSPVSYTVTAADYVTTKTWMVTVAVEQPINVPTTVKIVPKNINLGTSGYFLAFVTLPDAYKDATIDMSRVSCSDAPAIRMERLKIFPKIVVFIFRTSDLRNVPIGKKVSLTIKGDLKKSGTTYTFSGSDVISVTRKPTWQSADIKDVSRLSGDQLFKTYSP